MCRCPEPLYVFRVGVGTHTTGSKGVVMSDSDRPKMPAAPPPEVHAGEASFRVSLLAAERGAQHLGEISKSLERIARALEKMAARLP